MESKQLGMYLKIGGIALGVIMAVVLVRANVLPIVGMAVGAALYFAGEYVGK